MCVWVCVLGGVLDILEGFAVIGDYKAWSGTLAVSG